jgi:hypothetical protein
VEAVSHDLVEHAQPALGATATVAGSFGKLLRPFAIAAGLAVAGSAAGTEVEAPVVEYERLGITCGLGYERIEERRA